MSGEVYLLHLLNLLSGSNDGIPFVPLIVNRLVTGIISKRRNGSTSV